MSTAPLLWDTALSEVSSLIGTWVGADPAGLQRAQQLSAVGPPPDSVGTTTVVGYHRAQQGKPVWVCRDNL
jgi:hypothetical protein